MCVHVCHGMPEWLTKYADNGASLPFTLCRHAVTAALPSLPLCRSAALSCSAGAVLVLVRWCC